MLRVLSAANDPASRIENRIGEPSANPYLYVLSQLIAGLDGIDNTHDPGPPETDPYTADRTMLPKSLKDALIAMEAEPLFCRELGKVFVDYYLKIKRTELGRFMSYMRDNGIEAPGDDTSEWEQNEYFDFF
jgi:glutamine synthetase